MSLLNSLIYYISVLLFYFILPFCFLFSSKVKSSPELIKDFVYSLTFFFFFLDNLHQYYLLSSPLMFNKTKFTIYLSIIINCKKLSTS